MRSLFIVKLGLLSRDIRLHESFDAVGPSIPSASDGEHRLAIDSSFFLYERHARQNTGDRSDDEGDEEADQEFACTKPTPSLALTQHHRLSRRRTSFSLEITSFSLARSARTCFLSSTALSPLGGAWPFLSAI